VKVDEPVGTNYYIHLKDDFDKSCTIKKTETTYSNLDIVCRIEVEELEGAFHGISMVMNAPPDMCKYVSFHPYYYLGKEPGVGPATAEVSFDKDNKFLGGVVTPGLTYGSDGKPICDYDYTKSVPAGPDCCSGTYTLLTHKNVGSTDPAPADVTTAENWTGKAGNCLTGAGMTMTSLDDDGYPKTRIYYSDDGFNQAFNTPSSLELHGVSVYYANYFTGGVVPASIAGGNQYYSWSCLDDAFETKARISVEIREWNTIDQFALKDTGNPDVTGTDPDWGFVYDDYPDWDDLGLLTYPGMATQKD
jgi:hypothetical protein